MLLLQSNLKESNANMVFSNVRTWSEKLDREDNNNTVKQEILRTPPRCTFLYLVLNPLVSVSSNSLASEFKQICICSQQQQKIH